MIYKKDSIERIFLKIDKEIPVGLYVYDLLELDFEDLRNEN
jgi:ATP-dependent DNA ligase